MVPVSRVFSSSCWRLLQCLLKPRFTVQAALLLWGPTSRGGWAGSFACCLFSDASPCLPVENLLLLVIMKEFIQNLLEVLIHWCFQVLLQHHHSLASSNAASTSCIKMLCSLEPKVPAPVVSLSPSLLRNLPRKIWPSSPARPLISCQFTRLVRLRGWMAKGFLHC